jgi:gas vesicle protein
MGYVRGVMHGALLGSLVGLAFAPKRGVEFRSDVLRQVDKVRGQLQSSVELGDGGAPKKPSPSRRPTSPTAP